MMLAQTYPATDQMVQQIHQAVEQIPGQGFALLFLLVALNLLATIVVLWRQHRLARNQVQLAGMIRQLIQLHSGRRT